MNPEQTGDTAGSIYAIEREGLTSIKIAICAAGVDLLRNVEACQVRDQLAIPVACAPSPPRSIGCVRRTGHPVVYSPMNCSSETPTMVLTVFAKLVNLREGLRGKAART